MDKYIKWPHLVKKVSGVEYYLWRDAIKKGDILLSNMEGAGAGILNPSELPHGAHYVGRGFLTAIQQKIATVNEQLSKMVASEKRTDLLKKRARIESVICKYNIIDEVYYVVEASIKYGVRVTDLVTFMTQKDHVICVTPTFCSDGDGAKTVQPVIDSLGLPYDFGFSDADNMKYCFEVCADAYEETFDVKLLKTEYKILGLKVGSVYLSSAFLDEKNWKIKFNSMVK